MSNQSKADKTEGHLRRPDRSSGSGQYSGSAGSGDGGGGGGGVPPPSHISSSLASSSVGAREPALPTSKSFKKSASGNGRQLRNNAASIVSGTNVTLAVTTKNHAAQNDSHAPASRLSGLPGAADISAPRNAARAVPRAPLHNAAGLANSSASPAISKGDASGPFTLQFGTINPGIMNEMQIPARTSSAPPNLDEQKCSQAKHELYGAISAVPASTAPKQQQQQRTQTNVGSASQSNKGDPHPPTKNSMPIAPPPVPTVTSPQSSVNPMSGVPMPIPFQHQTPQITLQIGRSNPQMQPPSLAANSLQMPIALPVGSSPQVRTQLLFPGHLLPQQALVHQGPGISFASSISHQLTPQLGNIGGIGMTSPYTQQQGKFVAGPRKTPVKITDPVTHEEVKFDKRTDVSKDSLSSCQRPSSNVTPQSQPIAAYTPSHQMNYYSPLHANSYNPSPLVFHTPTSVPLTVPTNSQPPLYSYPANQSGQPVSFLGTTVFTAAPGGKSAPHTSLHIVPEVVNLEGLPVSPPSAQVLGTVKGPPLTSHVSSVSINVAGGKGEVPHILKSAKTDVSFHHGKSNTFPSSPTEQTTSSSHTLKTAVLTPSTDKDTGVTPVISIQKAIPDASLSTPVNSAEVSDSGHDERKKEAVRRSSSLKDNQRGSSKKAIKILQQQHQSDASNSCESLKVSSPRIIQDTFSGKEVSANPEVVLPSSISESHEVGISDAVDKKLPAATRRIFETEVSLDVPLKAAEVFNSSDSTSFQKNIPSQAATPLTRIIDSGLISPTLSPKEVLHMDQPMKKDGGTLEKSEKLKLSDHAGEKSKDFGNPKQVIASTLRDNNRLSIQNKLVDISSADSSCSSDSPGEHFAKDEPSSLNSIATEHKMTRIEDNEPCKESVKGVAAQDSCSTKSTEKVNLKVPEISLGVDMTEKTLGDVSKAKAVSGNKKKKKKEIYAKADAAGNPDLYNAYKRTDERNQVISSSRNIDSSVAIDSPVSPLDGSRNDGSAVEEDAVSKVELDDWEDAADISTPKLNAEEHVHPSNGEMKQQDYDGNEAIDRKYSRDFLLTFAQQFMELPMGFEISSDIAEALMSITLGKSHVETNPSPGRITDRSSGPSRVDRRMVGIMDDEKWSRSAGTFGRDLRLEVGHDISVNLRPGQGVNSGVSRNPRGQSPNHFGGGILSGPMQFIASQGGAPRNSSDADRWQRGSQRGLIPSPQTPLQVMHKAENKYEVGKVTDEEQAKQRQLKGILNKLTPQNFEKLFAQVIEVNIDNAVTLTGVISQIFDKALMEPTFCEMYANFCYHLAGALPEISEDNEKITFKRLLLNKCQEEFERGEREQAEANRNEEEGGIKQSEEEREEKRIQARRRMLGNIRLIGELYKKKMLTERIMHECIKKLLGQYQNPDEEDVEALCKLMSTIGEMIDHPKAKEHMDAYFEVMLKLSTDQKLSSRVRFMLKDAIDLRKNKWQQRRKVEGPKKIEEVHRDAAQERHAQSSRLSRAPVMNSSSRRGALVDSSFRGPAPLTSSSQQIGVMRGLPPQLRGYGSQDMRIGDRHQFENRTLSHPLPQRSVDDDSITLGPHGGLATGMSIRQPLILHPPASGISQNVVDPSRVVSVTTHQNGHNAREDAAARYVANRFSGTMHEQPSHQAHCTYPGSRDLRVRDRTFHRSSTTILPAGRTYGSLESSPAVCSETSFSEDVLREKSISTIREFYSAKDEGEVALCIKDLNAPSFYPSMLSLWVTDSFERKDMQRDMLANLLVNLCKSRDGLVSEIQLIQGFEQVLFSLEDAVNDAPRAPEFLGRFFAKVIMENVVPFRDIGRLILEGGEEPGRLREVGLAEDVLSNILTSIKLEKGDAVLNEIRSSSSLILEDFRPPQPKQSKLDAFL